MAKGFIVDGKFRPTGNSSRKSSREKSIESKSKLPMKDFRVYETYAFPDTMADFERHHIDTIEAIDFEDAEVKAIKLLGLESRKDDISEVGGDFGDSVLYEFETIPHDGRTGEEITDKQAEKLEEKDEELVSHVQHGFEVEEVTE